MPFDFIEAKTLIAIAANLEGPTPPLNMPAIPVNWGIQPIFDSPIMGAYDNKWQLWANPSTNQYAVVIRGTVGEVGSIWEDLMAVMIPATGTLPVGSVSFSYKLAEDPQAGVHLGFALGMAIVMLDDTNGIITQLQQRVPSGAEILIAGHSQGAAIATLCRSFLEYSAILAAKKYTYKTYLYAQPKPGNNHYACDFERIVSNCATGFCVTNTQDWVPQVPLTLQGLISLNTPNPLSVIREGNFALAIGGFLHRMVQRRVKRAHLAKHSLQIKALQQTLQKQKHLHIAKSTSPLDLNIMPSLNFVNCGLPITLTGTPGGNPNNPKDFFWQHHATMYYNLL